MTTQPELNLNPKGTLLCQQSIDVRWGDMDALGHVNNTVYFRYFEQLRIDWLERAGIDTLGTGATGFVIVDAHAEFLKPVIYPATLDARMAAHSPGRSSFVTTYTLSVNGTLYTRGESRVVWVDPTAGKSVPLPDEIRALIGAGHE